MLRLPSRAVLVLGLVTGVLTVLDEVVLRLVSPSVAAVVGALLVVCAGVVGPLLGPQFKAALHLPNWVSALVSYALAALTVLVTLGGLTPALRDVLAGVLAVFADLGFAPSQVPLAGGARLFRTPAAVGGTTGVTSLGVSGVDPNMVAAAVPGVPVSRIEHHDPWDYLWQVAQIPVRLPIAVVELVKLLLEPASDLP